MAEVIGFVSLKGGVGKTTLAASLAAELAQEHGKKVLLIDANYSAPNLGLHMDIVSPEKTIHDVLFGDRIKNAVHSKYGVDVIPGNFLFDRQFSPMKLKSKLTYVKRAYDFIVLDASPSLNDEVLSTVAASDRLFLVTTPDYASLSCAMKISKLIDNRGKDISGVIVNKIPRTFKSVDISEIQASLGIPVVSVIKHESKVEKALFDGKPANLGKSMFSKEIRSLGNAIAGKKERRNILKGAFSPNFRREEVNREVLRQSFYTSMFK